MLLSSMRCLFVVGVIVATTISVALILGLGPRNTYAQVSACVFSGYAWSDTIGWVALSGPGYDLQVDASGDVTGYAWSDNIGWIQAGGLSGFPSGSGTYANNATLQGTQFVGWMKALAGGTVENGGWDGWISLSGSNPLYGLGYDPSSGQLSGYAWGDTNVGWLSFSFGQCSPEKSCTTNADCSANQMCENNFCVVDSCQNGLNYVEYGPTCTCPIANGVQEVQRNGSCVISGGSCSAQYICAGNNLEREDTSCNDTLVQACLFGCSNGACIKPPPPSGAISATPPVVKQKATSNISWSAQNVSSCIVAGNNGDNWSCAASACAATSTQATSPITSQTLYTLSCTGLDGSILKKQATVNISPTFCELGATGCN